MKGNDLRKAKTGKSLGAIGGWVDSWNWICDFFKKLHGGAGLKVNRESAIIEIDGDCFKSEDGSVVIKVNDSTGDVTFAARYI